MVEACESVGDNFKRFAAFTHADNVACLDGVGGDVYHLAVDNDVTVKNELAGGCTCGSDAKTVYHVVQTAFEKLEEELTGDTLEARSFLEEVAELTFEYTIGVFGFLLFAELYAVFRSFAALVGTVLARWEIATGEDLVFAENRFAEFAGYFGLGTCVSCQCYYQFTGLASCVPWGAAATIER